MIDASGGWEGWWVGWGGSRSLITSTPAPEHVTK